MAIQRRQLNEKIYATFDGGERRKNLPGLCLELLAEQKKAWLDLRKGCDSLREVRERDVSCRGFSVRLQYNPGRIKSSLAAVAAKRPTSGDVSSAWIISLETRKGCSTGANT